MIKTLNKEDLEYIAGKIKNAGTVQDVKVNGESTLVGKDAIIKLKTINGTAITGEGDLTVGGVTPEEKALIDTIPSKASKEEVEAVEAKIPSLEGYATEEWVEDKGYLTEHQSLASYRTSAEQDTIDDTKQDTIEDLETIREGAGKGATAIQSVKTINGESLIGSGDIEIEVAEWTLAELQEIFN